MWMEMSLGILLDSFDEASNIDECAILVFAALTHALNIGKREEWSKQNLPPLSPKSVVASF